MKRKIRLRIFAVSALLMAGCFVSLPAAWASDGGQEDIAPGRVMAQKAVKEKALQITTDHRKIDKLKQPFTSGPEITKACVSCHSEAENQFHKTLHWTWIGSISEGKIYGKAGDSVNNFCISSNKQEDKSCLSCHPGWDGKGSKGVVNCLVCHGQKEINWSESFEDLTAFAGSSDPEEQEIANEIQANIQAAAQNVGLPTRKNCGSCHFYGGGGDGVKHGDLDSSITKPNKNLDVHMGEDGQNFECTRCHTTVLHNVAGRIYSTPAAKDRKSLIEDDLIAKITCESCHSSTPHQPGSKVNDHTDKVACQSCHIPEFARVNPTKMSWDWSKAGQTRDGKKFNVKGALGKDDYMSIKGEMTWAKSVAPEYAWFNGNVHTLTIKDTIDPGAVVPVTRPIGGPDDPNSRIFPFKVHRGKQPYDKINKNFLAPLLSGPDGYWETLDWPRAISKGMAIMNVPYSNKFDFVETSYVFPTTHMVAPREMALKCTQCHVKAGSRMVNIAGIYMPARDSAGVVDILGWIVVIGSFAGVCLHGLGRIFSIRGKEK